MKRKNKSIQDKGTGKEIDKGILKPREYKIYLNR
jgi:hypothetical protein